MVFYAGLTNKSFVLLWVLLFTYALNGHRDGIQGDGPTSVHIPAINQRKVSTQVTKVLKKRKNPEHNGLQTGDKLLLWLKLIGALLKSDIFENNEDLN